MPWPESAAEVVLLDADGNLFPSEEPAFVASCAVTNEFLARLGSRRRFEPDRLQAFALGRNFRSVAALLARDEGHVVSEPELADWVRREQDAVVRHLATVLRPDPEVTAVLRGLVDDGRRLAVVSSSALARLDACLEATGLGELLPAAHRYSAMDSLPVPTSKPDPAVYRAALASLQVRADQAVAVEDAVAGVRSAVGAGLAVVGNLAFVGEADRGVRGEELRAAGAGWLADGWRELERFLGVPRAAGSLA